MRTKKTLAATLAVAFGVAALAGASGAVAQSRPGNGNSYSPYFTPDLTRFALLADPNDLSQGATGEPVAELQGLLAELGYLDIAPAETPLGYFGPLTAAALERYQGAIGAPQTGEFDEATRAAVAEHLRSRGWLAGLTNPGFGMGGGEEPTRQMTQTSGSGYWRDGNYYNAAPLVLGSATTTANANPSGYWFNGRWYAAGPNGSPVATNSVGYWYEGNYYNAQPTVLETATTSASDIGTGEGFWLNGVWHDRSNTSGVSEDILTGSDD